MFSSIFKKTHSQPSNIKVKEKGKTSRSSFLLTLNARDTFSLRRRRPATFHQQRLESIPEETTLKLSQTQPEETTMIFEEDCGCNRNQTISSIAGALLAATGIIACVMLPLFIGTTLNALALILIIGMTLIALAIIFISFVFISRNLHELYHNRPPIQYGNKKDLIQKIFTDNEMVH